MFDKTDPGAWMIVVLVACLHLTFVLVRKFGTKPKWVRGSWLPAFMVLFGPAYFLSGSRFALIAALVFLGCGALIGVKCAPKWVAWVAPLISIFGLVWMVAWYDDTANSSAYTEGPTHWTMQSPQSVVEGIRTNEPNESISKAGYLDEDRFGWLNGSGYLGPFTLAEFTPLWHSFITDLGERKSREFRMWVPAGPINLSMDRALLFEKTALPDPKTPDPRKGISPLSLPDRVQFDHYSD